MQEEHEGPPCSRHNLLLLQDTIVAIRKGGDKLTVSNMDKATYKTHSFDTNPQQVSRWVVMLQSILAGTFSGRRLECCILA